MISEKKLKNYRKFFLRSIPLYILVVITCIISSCSFGLYAEYIRDDKALDKDNIIYADVVSILQVPQGATSHGYSNNWHVYYEYNDGNYSYEGYITVSGKETAEKYRGDKIPIYIDGQGHSIAVSEYNHRTELNLTKRALIIGIVSLIIFIVFTCLSVYLFIRHKKKAKVAEKQNDM